WIDQITLDHIRGWNILTPRLSYIQEEPTFINQENPLYTTHGVDTTEQDPTKLWMTTKSAYSVALTLQRTPSQTDEKPGFTKKASHDVSATNIVKDHIFKPGRAASHRPAQLEELAEEPGVILVQRCKVITGSCSVNVLLTTCKKHEWALKLNSWCSAELKDNRDIWLDKVLFLVITALFHSPITVIPKVDSKSFVLNPEKMTARREVRHFNHLGTFLIKKIATRKSHNLGSGADEVSVQLGEATCLTTVLVLLPEGKDRAPSSVTLTWSLEAPEPGLPARGIGELKWLEHVTVNEAVGSGQALQLEGDRLQDPEIVPHHLPEDPVQTRVLEADALCPVQKETPLTTHTGRTGSAKPRARHSHQTSVVLSSLPSSVTYDASGNHARGDSAHVDTHPGNDSSVMKTILYSVGLTCYKGWGRESHTVTDEEHVLGRRLDAAASAVCSSLAHRLALFHPLAPVQVIFPEARLPQTAPTSRTLWLNEIRFTRLLAKSMYSLQTSRHCTLSSLRDQKEPRNQCHGLAVILVQGSDPLDEGNEAKGLGRGPKMCAGIINHGDNDLHVQVIEACRVGADGFPQEVLEGKQGWGTEEGDNKPLLGVGQDARPGDSGQPEGYAPRTRTKPRSPWHPYYGPATFTQQELAESRGYGMDDVNGVVGMDSLGGVDGVDGVALADHVDGGDEHKSYREGVLCYSSEIHKDNTDKSVHYMPFTGPASSMPHLDSGSASLLPGAFIQTYSFAHHLHT
ncbi:hypothetical protein EI555_009338, partial [Monodon monoceros]